MEEANQIRSAALRYALIAVGVVFVAIGAIGIVVPLLPTTTFLLLAAACFARSSPRFHQWLLENRVLGAYIRDYLSGAGMTLRAKVLSISMLWIVIGSSAVFAVDLLVIRILLFAIAAGVTAHLIAIPLREP
jgi:hypothetical protein